MPEHTTYEFTLSMMTKAEYDSLEPEAIQDIPGYMSAYKRIVPDFAAEESTALTMNILLNIGHLDGGKDRICNTSKATITKWDNDVGRKYLHTDISCQPDSLNVSCTNNDKDGLCASFLLHFPIQDGLDNFTESGDVTVKDLMDKASSPLFFVIRIGGNPNSRSVFNVQLKERKPGAGSCSHTCSEGEATQDNNNGYLSRDISVGLS